MAKSTNENEKATFTGLDEALTSLLMNKDDTSKASKEVSGIFDRVLEDLGGNDKRVFIPNFFIKWVAKKIIGDDKDAEPFQPVLENIFKKISWRPSVWNTLKFGYKNRSSLRKIWQLRHHIKASVVLAKQKANLERDLDKLIKNPESLDKKDKDSLDKKKRVLDKIEVLKKALYSDHKGINSKLAQELRERIPKISADDLSNIEKLKEFNGSLKNLNNNPEIQKQDFIRVMLGKEQIWNFIGSLSTKAQALNKVLNNIGMEIKLDKNDNGIPSEDEKALSKLFEILPQLKDTAVSLYDKVGDGIRRKEFPTTFVEHIVNGIAGNEDLKNLIEQNPKTVIKLVNGILKTIPDVSRDLKELNFPFKLLEVAEFVDIKTVQGIFKNINVLIPEAGRNASAQQKYQTVIDLTSTVFEALHKVSESDPEKGELLKAELVKQAKEGVFAQLIMGILKKEEPDKAKNMEGLGITEERLKTLFSYLMPKLMDNSKHLKTMFDVIINHPKQINGLITALEKGTTIEKIYAGLVLVKAVSKRAVKKVAKKVITSLEGEKIQEKFADFSLTETQKDKLLELYNSTSEIGKYLKENLEGKPEDLAQKSFDENSSTAKILTVIRDSASPEEIPNRIAANILADESLKREDTITNKYKELITDKVVSFLNDNKQINHEDFLKHISSNNDIAEKLAKIVQTDEAQAMPGMAGMGNFPNSKSTEQEIKSMIESIGVAIKIERQHESAEHKLIETELRKEESPNKFIDEQNQVDAIASKMVCNLFGNNIIPKEGSIGIAPPKCYLEIRDILEGVLDKVGEEAKVDIAEVIKGKEEEIAGGLERGWLMRRTATNLTEVFLNHTSNTYTGGLSLNTMSPEEREKVSKELEDKLKTLLKEDLGLALPKKGISEPKIKKAKITEDVKLEAKNAVGAVDGKVKVGDSSHIQTANKQDPNLQSKKRGKEC